MLNAVQVITLIKSAFMDNFGAKLPETLLHIEKIEPQLQGANWKLVLDENWSGSNPKVAHRHAIFLHDTADALQMTHPKISFGESA